MCQSLVSLVLVPVNTMLSLWVIVAPVWLNFTSHPASHSWPTESSDVPLSSGTTCTVRALGGRLGRLSSATCVDVMMAPFGVRILTGFVAGMLLMTGNSVVQKCDVALVSAMIFMGLVGGPVLWLLAVVAVWLMSALSLYLLQLTSGFPLRHSLLAAAAALAVASSLGRRGARL
jgi:hypothetical protein